MLKGLTRWICRKYAARKMAHGDLHTAFKLLSIAVACGDDSPQTKRNLSELQSRLGEPAPELSQPAPAAAEPPFAQALRDAFEASQAGADPERPARLMLRSGGDSFDALSLMNVLGARRGATDGAIALIAEALWRNPGSAEVHTLLSACAWSMLSAAVTSLRERVTKERSGEVSPMGLLPLPEADAGEQHQCARQYAQQQYGDYLSRAPLWAARAPRERDRLRVGYLSADYHEHPTSFLLARVIELHDRARFEVFGYSCGLDSEDSMRRRMRAAFDSFRDIRLLSHEVAAQQIVDDEIDILVDLKGYTTNARLEILALRPAPVQATWLGYAGTLGHPRLADYLIGDPIVSPLQDGSHFTEALALMPNCYQPNDQQRAIGERPSRAAAGLPANGFVFCSFNQSYKFTPEMFDLWCRLLGAVPGSVLWLLETIEAGADNLRREARARGVDPGRIVFAPKCSQVEHLARLQLADLALDTFPYTSHTTASDALWAGVPLLARQGETFASRASASIVHAAGLPDLVAGSAQDYYRLALALAAAPERLAQVRARLAADRMSCALFDSRRFTLDLERLLRRMWQGYRAGSMQPIVLGAHDD